MKTATIKCSGKWRLPLSGRGRYRMRCTRAANQLWLVVIKLPRRSNAQEPALEVCLLAINGVHQVHIDTLQDTLQLLVDSTPGTMDDIRLFLAATGLSPAPSS